MPVYKIEHLLASGSNFNGALPSLSGTAFEAQESEGTRIYVDGSGVQAQGDAGGLFNFPFIPNVLAWEVVQVMFDMTASYTFNLVDPGASLTIELATGSNSVALAPGWVLGRNETLSLTTTGGSSVGRVRVVARPTIPLPPTT